MNTVASLTGFVCVIASAQTPQADSGEGAVKEITYDLGRLKGRKLDPAQVQFFARSARFLAGQQWVTLVVNGNRLGSVNTSFNHEGQLCLGAKLLEDAGLVTPQDAGDKATTCDSAASVDSLGFLAKFPQTVVDLRPGKSEVYLIVPAQALQPRERASRQFNSGGIAAMLNYEAFNSVTESKGTSMSYQNVNTVAGLNAGDWLFRSSQNYSASATGSQLNHIYAYGQRTFNAIDATAQAGQINIANSVFSGIALTGIQIVPEDSLRAGPGESPVRIEGVARSPARIEVRQNGNLIHTSMIPEGPYLLTDLGLNRRLDVVVTVIEDNGSKKTFTLLAASLDGSAFDTTPGYSFSAGQYRPGSNQSEKPFVVSVNGTWPFSQTTQVNAGALGSADYQGLAWSMGYRLTPETTLSMSQSASNANKLGQRGIQLSASLSTQLRKNLSLGLSTTQRTEGYRDFLDSVYREENVEDILENGGPLKAIDSFRGQTRDQYGASLGLGNTPVGNFSVSTSYSRAFDNQSTQHLSATWSASYKRASFSVNVRKNIGNSGYEKGLTTYVSATVPFGENVKTYANTDKSGTRVGATLSDKISDSASYQVRADHDDASHRTNVAASANLLPRYTRLNVGYSRSSEGTSNYNGRLSGAVVAHGNGVTLAPYPVDDTFGVLSVGDLSGVKIMTPRGPVWTDMFGQAIAPSLEPHRDSQLSVSGASLPRNVDIGNGVKKLKPSRGSVNRIKFDVSTTRRTMLVVKDPKGLPLAKGLAVLNEHQQYVTTSIGNGKVYFPTLEPNTTLNVRLSDEETCQIRYSQPKHADLSKIIETIEATCVDI
ncbi:fimbria/pilus outer membrane usher protein [Pseudomonas marginalis]|uniref:fimbria/pilus outer membrane usher protein n=1 Tax=Pseudomonas marginalis TaxID=298 RepID=UPI003BA312AE